MSADFGARLMQWADAIDADGTPSQIGPSADELREVARYVRSLEASQDPWFGWSGGRCPFNSTIPVIVQWRNGVRYSGIAGGFQWHWGDSEKEWDIVAYCLPDPPPSHRTVDVDDLRNAYDPETGLTRPGSQPDLHQG